MSGRARADDGSGVRRATRSVTTPHCPDEAHRGKEICFGANENAISIADVTDKANPVALSSATYPTVSYSHQGWITEDHRYFFLDDEGDEIAGTAERTRIGTALRSPR